MIKINLQMFAKSNAYQQGYRKSKAYASGNKIQEEMRKREAQKPANKKKNLRGEAVSAVKRNDEYQIYVYENDKEKPYTDSNGNPVYRTGSQIAEKMIYNKNREGWESKAQLANKKKDGLAKVRKYIIRKRIK